MILMEGCPCLLQESHSCANLIYQAVQYSTIPRILSTLKPVCHDHVLMRQKMVEVESN